MLPVTSSGLPPISKQSEVQLVNLSISHLHCVGFWGVSVCVFIPTSKQNWLGNNSLSLEEKKKKMIGYSDTQT